MTTKNKAVQLGRFAPFHIGHQRATKKLVNKYGAENVLVLVGSSNNVNERTPFTYEQRARMISTLFPQVEIAPLPDIDPSKNQFQADTIPAWLDQIRELEASRGEQFTFCGGSKGDIDFFEGNFPTDLIVDRETCGTSATLVRQALIEQNHQRVAELLDPRIVDQVTADFNKNIKTILTQ